MTGKKTLSILYLEDNNRCAKEITSSLKQKAINSTLERAKNISDFETLLTSSKYDVIIIANNFQTKLNISPITITQNIQPQTPIIIISDTIGDEPKVKIMKQGVSDFIAKVNLNSLPKAIKQVIKDKNAAQDQQELNDIQKELIQATSAVLFKTDIAGNFVYVNDQLCALTGFDKQTLSKKNLPRLIHPKYRSNIQKIWDANINGASPFSFECQLLTANKKTVWIECNCTPITDIDKHATQILGTMTNISELKATQHELKKLARYDALTELPNRRMFEETLTNTLEELKRGTISIFAVLYIDLDQFKNINDTVGHHYGDLLLKEAGNRFKKIIRMVDFISRVGGDEFVIILKDVKNIIDVNTIAQRILRAFQTPFYIEDHELITTVSIGVLIINKDNLLTLEEIIAHSDHALYRAKAQGRNRIEFFTKEIDQQIKNLLSLEKSLHNSIKNHELSLAFQPIYQLDANQIIGCEVLSRWHLPNKKDIPPNIFIPIAEESNLINSISKWVIEHAFQQYRHWLDRYLNLAQGRFMLSINLSPSHFFSENLIQHIYENLKLFKVNPADIMFEITESSVMDNPNIMKDIFTALNGIGVCIAIDDFGTSSSSLSYLKQMPLKMLKIDKSFTQQLETDNNAKVVAKSIISLANAMELDVIAEGVETKTQLNILCELGCHYAQGYYLCKPLPASDLESYFKKVVNM